MNRQPKKMKAERRKNMKAQQPDDIPIMDYAQYRKACRLVHECCNYDQGNCLLLDRGDGCVCVQRISYSLLCRWFQTAVLPLDHELYAVLLCKPGTKRCCLCDRRFVPRSNRAKYCPSCASRMKQHMARERKRKQRRKCHALGPEKVL